MNDDPLASTRSDPMGETANSRTPRVRLRTVVTIVAVWCILAVGIGGVIFWNSPGMRLRRLARQHGVIVGRANESLPEFFELLLFGQARLYLEAKHRPFPIAISTTIGELQDVEGIHFDGVDLDDVLISSIGRIASLRDLAFADCDWSGVQNDHN